MRRRDARSVSVGNRSIFFSLGGRMNAVCNEPATIASWNALPEQVGSQEFLVFGLGGEEYTVAIQKM